MAQTAYAPPYVPPRRTLPIGVAILAILIGLFGVILLLGAVLVLLVVAAHVTLGAPAPVALFGVSLLAGILLLIFAILLLVVASGLWHLEMWALVLSVVTLLILWIGDVVAGNLLSFGSLVILVLLVYLVLVRHHFR